MVGQVMCRYVCTPVMVYVFLKTRTVRAGLLRASDARTQRVMNARLVSILGFFFPLSLLHTQRTHKHTSCCQPPLYNYFLYDGTG